MRYLYVFIFLLIHFCIVQGQNIITLSSGNITDGVFSQAPLRSIEYVDNSILVTYTFEKATIMDDPLYEGAYMWKYVGFGVNNIPAQPAIPYRIDSFTIPKSCYAIVELVDSQFVDLPFLLSPARPPLIDSGDEVYSFDNVPNISSYRGYYPSSIVSLNDIEVYRGNSIANVIIAPLKYNYETGVIRAYTKISYKLSFINNVNTLGDYLVQPNVESENILLANATLNTSYQLDRNDQSILAPPQRGYLILSKPKFESSIEKFVEWKKLLGFDVQAILNSSWTPDLIKSTIRNYYNQNSNLYYLLIVGDMEDVPAQRSNLVYQHVTDYYYSCLDGENDITPDLLCGRIPVKTNEEANVVIDKIINYEKHPVQDSLFYKNGLHCAFFQDDSIDTYEDRRFTLTSEEIRNSVMDEGINVLRVYTAKDSVNPLFWNNDYFSFGDSIPFELRRPNFTWSGDSIDINAAINSGTFYVLHRDHGGMSAWGNPSYTKDNINSLNNGNKLPVVFSINCYTGYFNHVMIDCFCEAFLKKQNGGCVAIYGATNRSLSGYNDALSEGMFDAIWPSEKLRPTFPDVNGTGGITPTPLYELGQILNQGKTRMSETYGTINSDYNLYTKELFHCFGDPSMRMYTASPTPFTNVDIIRSEDSLYVNLNGDTATIVFQDLLEGTTMCTTGTSATLPTNPTKKIRICISYHNRIPYICEVEPYIIFIQNETVVESANYEAENIMVGEHVTNLKPQGPVVLESGDVRLKAKRILIDSGTSVNKGASLELINK